MLEVKYQIQKKMCVCVYKRGEKYKKLKGRVKIPEKAQR